MTRTPPAVPDLPELSSGASLDQVVEWLQRLRTQNMAREPIAKGSALDKFVTRGELVDLKLLTYRTGGAFGVGTLEGGGSGVVGGSPVYDASPPSPITGLAVTGMLTHFLVEFDGPVYTNGGGNAYTEIYAANWAGTPTPLPTFSDAVLVYELSGSTTIAAIPAQPSQTTHFWVGAVTRGGVRQVDGVGPTGGLHGVSATTGADVSGLLNVLNGQITQSQLFSTLGARINLIDDVAAVPGSVNGRISTSATSLTAAFTSADTTVLSTANAYVGTYAYSKAAVDGAFTSQSSTLTAAFNSADATTLASAQAYTYSRATIDGSISSAVSTVTASYTSAISTAVSTEATARATDDGKLFAQYTVKIDTNGYVSGFGLASTLNNASPYSQFIIRADSFTVASPSGPGIAPVTPFTVVTTSFTLNGVTVPVGIYADAAFFLNGSITNAKIANAAIDDAKISNLSVAKLIAGSIGVGEYIQSTGFVSGSAGWRITGNGVAEFSGVIVRGTIVASGGSIGGATIDSTGVQSVSYVAGSAGWRLDNASGIVYAASLHIQDATATRIINTDATGTAYALQFGTNFWVKANGDAYFGGVLKTGIASKGSVSSSLNSSASVPTGTGVTSISVGTVSAMTCTVGSGDLLLIMSLNVYLSTHTNTPYFMALDILDGTSTSLFDPSNNPAPVIIGELTNTTAGGAIQPWVVSNTFTLTLLIPGGTLTAGSHTFYYKAFANFYNAGGSANTISGCNLSCHGQMEVREFLA